MPSNETAGAAAPPGRPFLLRYGLAVLLSVVAGLLTMAVHDLLTGSVFLLFFPAIMGAAWFGGFGPSLVVVASALITADVWYLEPLGVLSLPGRRNALWFATYAAVGTSVGWIASRLVRARAEAEIERRRQASLAGELVVAAAELQTRADASEKLLAELRRTHDALARSEHRFRAMADHAPILIWESGTDGGFTYLNEPWLAFTGRTLEQEQGDGWTEGVHADDLERCLNIYRASFEARAPFRMEYRLRRHDGEYRWLLDVGTPRRDADGRFEGYIGSCIDVQDHVEAEQKLQESAAQLEELAVQQEQMVEELQTRTVEAENARSEAQLANQAKSRFLAVMSHELRTPLNAILGYADLLGGGVGGAINEVQARHIARIRDSVVHLRDLIDQILSLSRIEAGREELNVGEYDLAVVVRAAAEMVLPQATKRGLELDVHLPSSPLPVRGDEGKVRQIVLNLLSNAVKFTDRGEISVHAERDGDASVYIRVRDTGVGIAPDDVKRIFEPFTQVDQSMTRRAAGTGLGLSVSRQLADLMGGSLTVRSTPGQGSTFELTVPVDLSFHPRPQPIERRRSTPA